MRLSPSERDRLLIFTTAELARARRARGLRLNVPEATALIADAVCEAARDGARLPRRHRGRTSRARSPTTCCPAWPRSSPRSRSRPCSTTAPGWSSSPTRSAPDGADGADAAPGAVLLGDQPLPNRPT